MRHIIASFPNDLWFQPYVPGKGTYGFPLYGPWTDCPKNQHMILIEQKAIQYDDDLFIHARKLVAAVGTVVAENVQNYPSLLNQLFEKTSGRKDEFLEDCQALIRNEFNTYSSVDGYIAMTMQQPNKLFWISRQDVDLLFKLNLAEHV